MYLDFWLFLSQMEDYSIFSALGKISILVQNYFCKMETYANFLQTSIDIGEEFTPKSMIKHQMNQFLDTKY